MRKAISWQKLIFSRRFSTLQRFQCSQIFLPHYRTLEMDRSGRCPWRPLLHLLLPALEQTYSSKHVWGDILPWWHRKGFNRKASNYPLKKKKIPYPDLSCHSSHQPKPPSLITQLFEDTVLPSSGHPLFLRVPSGWANMVFTPSRKMAGPSSATSVRSTFGSNLSMEYVTFRHPFSPP